MARQFPAPLCEFIKLSIFSTPIILFSLATVLVKNRYEFGLCEIIAGSIITANCHESFQVAFNPASDAAPFIANVKISHKPPNQEGECENEPSQKSGENKTCHFNKSDSEKKIEFFAPWDYGALLVSSIFVGLFFSVWVACHVITFILALLTACSKFGQSSNRGRGRAGNQQQNAPSLNGARNVPRPPPAVAPQTTSQKLVFLPSPGDTNLYAQKLHADGWMCGICLHAPQTWQQVGDLKTPHCHHAFHAGCIVDWENKGGGDCPLCQRATKTDA